MDLMIFYALIPIGIVLLIVGTKFWKETIIVTLVWVLVEGAARKWIVPQFQGPALLVKDAALFAAYCGYLIAPKQAAPTDERQQMLWILIGVLTVYCALEMLNPALPNPLIAIYGLKNYLMYIPLAVVIPQMCRTRQDLKRFLFWTVVVSIPICMLGLYQFSQPPTSWINQYVMHEAGVEAKADTFGLGVGEFRYGRARTSSTFSYIGGFTTYLLFVLPVLGAMLISNAGSRRDTIIAAAALAFALGAAFTTGSRTLIFIFAASTPALILGAGMKGLLPLGAALRVAVLGIAGAFVIFFAFGTATEAFVQRTEVADSTVERAFSPIDQTLDALSTSPTFGLGVGSNSNAAPTLAGDPDWGWLNGHVYEVETARVLQDLGLIGWFLVYLIKVIATYRVYKNLKRSRSKLFAALHMAILAFMVPHFVLFTINNPTGGVMYWAAFGLSIALNRIEARERQALEMSRAPVARERPPRPAIA